MKFESKIAIVSGADSLLGRQAATRLAQAGAQLVLVANTSLRDLEDELRRAGVQFQSVQGDPTDPSTAQTATEVAQARFGTVHVLVNAWDRPERMLVEDLSEAAWDKAIDSAVKATFNMTRSVSKLMVEAKYGRIVNLAFKELLGSEASPHGAAAAAAVVSLTRTSAIELGKFAITANVLVVGDVAWPGQAEGISASAAASPLRRSADPSEITDTLLFLASDFASYVTGHSLYVAGGQELLPSLVLESSGIVAPIFRSTT